MSQFYKHMKTAHTLEKAKEDSSVVYVQEGKNDHEKKKIAYLPNFLSVLGSEEVSQIIVVETDENQEMIEGENQIQQTIEATISEG